MIVLPKQWESRVVGSLKVVGLLGAWLASGLTLPAIAAEVGPPIHYTGHVTPTPQQVRADWRSIPLDDRPVSIELVGAPRGGELGVKVLAERLAATGAGVSDDPVEGGVRIIAGLLEDERVQQLDEQHGLGFKQLVLPSEGYAIRVAEGDAGTMIVAAGQDARGVFYALATLYQQTGQVDGQPVLRVADLDDYPVWQERFFGDYGVPDRGNLVRLALYKINGYAITHRYNWRNFRADHNDYAEKLERIQRFKNETGLIDFELQLNLYAERPRENPIYDATNDEHFEELIERIELGLDHGIRHVMICFDDWTPMVAGAHVVPSQAEEERFGRVAGNAHGQIVRRVYDRLKPEYPHLQLSVCPAPYSINHVKQYDTIAESRYLRDLAAALPPDVPVVWTGPVVSSPRIEREDFLQYASYLMNEQPMFLWDNTAAVRANNRDIPQAIVRYYDGFAADSRGRIYMNTFVVSKPWIALSALSSNDYLWNPDGFDTVASHENVVEQRFGPGKYELVEAFYESQRAIEKALDEENPQAAAALEAFETVIEQMASAGLPTKWFAATRGRYNALVHADPARVTVSRLDSPPTIDGKIDDAAWRDAAELTAFEAMHKDQTAAHTVGRIGYDDTALYIALEAHHQEPLRDPIGADYRDAPVYALSDNLQIFLGVGEGAPNWVQLAFDHQANIYDSGNGIKEWDSEWDVAVASEPGVWKAEVRIPFESLMPPFDKAPTSGDMWTGNFCRTRPVQKEHSAWSATHGNGFVDPSFWGELRFE